jgi:hypothetical protein
VLEEFALEAGATKGRDLRFGVRRIRSGAYRGRLGGEVWLDFKAPQRQFVVDVPTATSARTNTNVPHVGSRLPLPGCLVLGAQHGKLGADLRTLAAELVDRMAILVVVRRFIGMGDADPRSLQSNGFVRMHHFVRRTTIVPFRRFGRCNCREFMQRIIAILHDTFGSYLRDA